MSLDNYTNLKAAIADHLNRADLTTQIVDFITIAEARMNRELRLQSMESLETLTTVAGTATVALPTRYRAAKWMYVDGSPKQSLSYMPGEQMFMTYGGSENGKPLAFTRQSGNFRFAPTPDAAYTIYALCIKAFQNLSGSVATNGLLDYAPDIYLYSSLSAAKKYIKDEKEWLAYEEKYKGIRDSLNLEDKEQRYSGSVKRIRSTSGNP